MLIVSQRIKSQYPGARMGILAVENVINPPSHTGLEKEKARLEDRLRTQYAKTPREQLNELPSLRPYVSYYRPFRKTYHVLLQLESVIHKDRPRARVGALVEAMFMTELQNLLLTAGHDLDTIESPLTLDVASGQEVCLLIGGKEVTLKEKDMLVRDAQGVLSSIIYGPDFRTRIRESTRRAVFTVYAPEGISGKAVADHLDDLEANIRLISPRATLLEKRIYP